MRIGASLTVAAVLTFGTVAPVSAAADDLAAVRARADEATAGLAAARSRLAELESEIAALEGRRAEAEARVQSVAGVVGQMAVREYIARGESVLPPPFKDKDIRKGAKADAIGRIVSGDLHDTAEEYRIARDDLARADEELAAARAETTAAVAAMEAEAAVVDAELRRLATLAGRSGARPAPGTVIVLGDGGSWVCPVQGPVSFTNDWGNARSGGRRHQGTDMMSPRGTPVVASVSGSVRGHNSSLGGLSYYLTGDDGNTYFGTHLQSLAGVEGRVEKGTVVGYVGNSGNARGTSPHLHFEIHPGGGSAINPYHTLSANC